jgi:hypothetical protein
MEDLIEQANEIQESLGRSYYVADEVDEADLQAELDALGLDDELVGENETPSYLQDSTALPDFVDAAPVEEEVSAAGVCERARVHVLWACRHQLIRVSAADTRRPRSRPPRLRASAWGEVVRRLRLCMYSRLRST